MTIILEDIADPRLKTIAEKVKTGERVTSEEAIYLYDSSDLLSIGAIANLAKESRLPLSEKDYVYFINNHHINLTNICEGTCKFCAYKKDEKDSEAYFLSVKEVEKYLQKKVSKDIKELHIVSAINKSADLNYYVDLFTTCKKHFPEAHIQALTAVEIDYLANLEKISTEEVLKKLISAGLGSIPGGGAEIFSEEIRKKVCPDKISGNKWLEVMEIAHSLGINSNVTMLTGIGESYKDRVNHMERVRRLQDKTNGFMTFIPLFCHYENTEIEEPTNNTGYDNLKDLAISRIYLDNIPHIKAFWIQLGIKMAQISIAFGVDDLDGTVVKEQISSSAGAIKANQLTKEKLLNLIKNAKKVPVERDTVYNIIKIYD